MRISAAKDWDGENFIKRRDLKHHVEILKKYWFFCLLAPLFMVGEVTMDLLQPDMMADIVASSVAFLPTLLQEKSNCLRKKESITDSICFSTTRSSLPKNLSNFKGALAFGRKRK